MILDSEGQRQLLQKVIGSAKIDGTFAESVGPMQALSQLLQEIQQAQVARGQAGEQTGGQKLIKKSVNKKKKENKEQKKEISY